MESIQARRSLPFSLPKWQHSATSLTAVRRTSRPWSSSYDTALPMLRSRSVTGWPHHLIPQISCAPAVQRDLQNHSGPGRHRGNLRCVPLGMWLDKESCRLGSGKIEGQQATRRAKLRGSEVRQRTCFASSLMRERYPPSPVLRTAVFSLGVAPASRQSCRLGSGKMDSRRLPEGRSLAGARFVNKSAVTKRVGRRPVEHYHQLPPFITPTPWVPKPKSSRRTVVNRVTSGCKSRRNRHCSNFNHNLGHEEDSQSAPLGTARHPERNRGARPFLAPR